jgi:hypothetical protein
MMKHLGKYLRDEKILGIRVVASGGSSIMLVKSSGGVAGRRLP